MVKKYSKKVQKRNTKPKKENKKQQRNKKTPQTKKKTIKKEEKHHKFEIKSGIQFDDILSKVMPLKGGKYGVLSEGGENYPFIMTIKYKNFEDLGGIIDTNFKSYPRVFTMGPYTKIRGLRIKIFGFLCKYYPLPESVINLLKKNFSEYKTLEEIKKDKEQKDKLNSFKKQKID